MYISPIQQKQYNTLNNTNFKHITVQYRNINDSECQAINKKVKQAIDPIMNILKKIADGYNVLISVSYESPGRSQNLHKDVVRIAVGDHTIWQTEPGLKLLTEPLKDVLYSKFGIQPITSDTVVIKQFHTHADYHKDGKCDYIRYGERESTVDELRKNIIKTLKSTIKSHKWNIEQQMERLNQLWILSDSDTAKALRNLDEPIDDASSLLLKLIKPSQKKGLFYNTICRFFSRIFVR